MTARIAIVGGGIAGLTLAAALDPYRFEVTIHEAQPERVTAGAALGLWGSARRVLRGLGTLPGAGGRVTGGTLHRIDGRRLLAVRGPGPRLVDRPLLLTALATGVPSSARRVHEGVADPAGLDADLVIGADGVRSRVRGLVEATAARRRSTPYLALRGILPGAPRPAEIGEYWGGGRICGIAPLDGDRTYWFTTHRSELDEPLGVPAALAEARERFGDVAPAVQRLLAAADQDTLATRLWVAPPLHRYVRDRFVVIGDAAHAMLPNLGRGACSAIVDAATLAATLNGGGDLRRWQARRLPATQTARLASGALMRLALAAP